MSAGNDDFLFLPSVTGLYSLPSQLKSELAGFRSDSFLQNLPGEREYQAGIQAFFSDFLASHNAPSTNDVSWPTENKIEDLVLNISQICNLACSYCYADDLNSAGKIMSKSVCQEALDRAYQMSDTGLKSLKFLGGEPTLAFEEIKYAVEYAETICAAEGYRLPSFVIVTNGTKINAEMAQFFASKNFYVLVSMDGPQSIHNLLRPFTGGRGSYSKALDAIVELKKKNVEVAIEAVYTQTHYKNGVSIRCLLDHFLEIGIREMQITLALGTWHGENTQSEIKEVASDFAAAARRCIRSFLTDDPFLLRGIQFVIDGFANKKKNSHVCGAGRTFMAVNYDGAAYPCYLLETSETAYGFVGKEWNEERYALISSKFMENGKEYHDTCKKCWAKEICQSCLGSSFLIDKQISKPPAWFCATQKTLISSVLGEIASALQGEQKEAFLANLSHFLKPRKFEERGEGTIKDQTFDKAIV
ncbi:putative radical SAM domain protein [Roseibium sp. TrichSKD4]|nr:putative radical SAM domain protein [Roseibium sp. TrichSKD4]